MYKKLMNSYWLKLALITLLLIDVGYTFKQHASLPLDGDIAPIVVPDPHYQDVLKDPLGFQLISHPRDYPASNRYFSHIAMITYFKHFYTIISPFFKDKIECIYFMQGLFNTTIQILLLFLMSVLVLGHFNFWKNDFLLIAMLIAPFFQAHGLYSSIGIIDNAVTYTFFYALPLAILIIYCLPFYLAFYHKKPTSNFLKPILWPIWLGLAIVVSFSGSIIAPLVLLCSPIVILWMLYQKGKTLHPIKLVNQFFKLPKPFLIFWIWLFVWCIYSFYIGQFNAEGQTDVGLIERYEFLMKGLPKFFFHKITFIVIALILIINIYIIQSYETTRLNRFFKQLLLLLVFISCFYVLLLPLGGYRSYRPWIIRYDVFMPITLMLITLVVLSTWRILQTQLKENKLQYSYLVFIVGIIAFFSISDNPEFYLNDCQNDALHQIEASNESIIRLENDCTILRWSKIKHPENSKVVGDLLHIWGITENPVLFYQE